MEPDLLLLVQRVLTETEWDYLGAFWPPTELRFLTMSTAEAKRRVAKAMQSGLRG